MSPGYGQSFEISSRFQYVFQFGNFFHTEEIEQAIRYALHQGCYPTAFGNLAVYELARLL